MTPVQFVPRREIWFVSAFVNSAAVDAYARARELATLLQAELQGLKAEQLPRLADRPELQARALAMAHSVQLRGSWNPYVDGFPYHDENTGLHFNKLGYFEFEVEYFADNPERRSEIEPVLVQQPAVIALERLRRLAAQKKNSPLRFDTVSPIYIFVVSSEVLPAAPPWTQAQILAHKQAIGVWTEVYSGAWPDYTDEVYERRIAGNLSNRLSELHIIRRNSGFLYMAPDNLRQFFDSYMRTYVVAPTAQLRAMHFALFSINESLDILLMRQAREDFRDLAGLVAEWHTHAHRALELRTATTLELLERLDALRRPERFARWRLACEADARGRTGLEDRPYPQTAWLAQAREVAAAVPVQPLVERGLKGPDFAEALRLARLDALRAARKRWTAAANAAGEGSPATS